MIRAQNLPRLDWPINDSNFIGQSDPFVKLKLISEKNGGDVLEQVPRTSPMLTSRSLLGPPSADCAFLASGLTRSHPQGKRGEAPKAHGWRQSTVRPNTLHPDFSESFRFHLLASAPSDGTVPCGRAGATLRDSFGIGREPHDGNVGSRLLALSVGSV